MAAEWVAALADDVLLAVAVTFAALVVAAATFLVELWLLVGAAPPTDARRPSPPTLPRDVARADAGDMTVTAASAVAATNGMATPRANGRRSVLKPAPARYTELMNMARQRVLEGIAETRWKPLSRYDACNVSIVPENTLPDRYRAVGHIRASPDTVFRCLFDMKIREKWDKGMVGNANRTVATYENSFSITYYATGSFMGVSGRDFLDLRQLHQLEDNKGYLIVAHSVEHEDQPKVPGFVRAHNHPNGQLIKRREDGTCELTYFVQVDLGGWISKSMLRLALAGSLARIFSDLKAYCESLPYINGLHIDDESVVKASA